MPIGNKGFIGVKKEVTWGSRDGSGANDFYLPFISESLTHDIEKVLSAVQMGVVDKPKGYQGQRSYAGDVVIEVHPASLGAILRSAFDVPDTDPAGTTETLLENCEDAWNELVDGGVISGIDVVDYKKGSASVKIQVTADVAAGDICASEVVASTDMHLDTALRFWIKSSVACDASDLAIRISESVNCGVGGTYKDVLVPALVAGVWTECTVTMATMTDFNAVISIGLILKVDKGEMTVNIDDIRRVVVGTAATAKQHIFIPRQEDFDATLCPLNPYTFEVYRDQGNSFQFLGSIVNTLKLNFSTSDKILKATCGIIAKDLGDVAKTSVALETTNPFMWNNAVISIGDSPTVNNDIESFGIDYDNKCVAKYALNNTAIARKIIREGFRTTMINFVIDFVDRTEYAKFLLGTEQAFLVKFEGAEIAGNTGVYYTLQIDMPKVQYSAFPINIGGPGRLSCAVTAEANYSPDDLFAIKATLINLTATY